MTNTEISLILKEIAEILELKGENFYKIRAYRRGARNVETLSEDMTRLVQENRLRQISGIGKGIASQIEEIVRTGRSSLLEELRSEVPTGLRRILGIPGVGVKSAQKLYYQLGISSLNQLKEACEQDQIKELPGFGEKIQEKILQGISKVESSERETLLGIALPMNENIIATLEKFPEIENVETSGSVRRRKGMVQDIDLVVKTQEPKTVKEKIIDLPAVYQVLEEQKNVLSVLNTVGIRIDFYLTSEKNFYYYLFLATGSEDHIEEVANLAFQKGYELKKAGLIDKETEQGVELYSEFDLYNKLDLPYIAPELRENRGEVEKAHKDKLPSLINVKDIKGDLHIHTNWTDGAGDLQDMVDGAKNMGYEYIAITDHSKSLKIANGLSEFQLERQVEEIQKLNHELKDFTIFTGTEVDILKNGELDFSSDILRELDFVIASIHQGFNDPGDVITNRICKAMENPYVKAIAHPTGRLLGKRQGHDLDFERLFDTAVATNTALEINSSIDRLDLPEELVLQGINKGVKFLISTDAHSTESFKDIQYGVFIARRGWLSKEQVINTYGLAEFTESFLG
ncbi:DNA polymerase/3'-5' exonuclease PolX [Natranaerobius thermophilus]|uniref:DNA-directed DNA polymerase n=1 Tax=Natranaerobius thermophilus (strain ATCC BAA-1301 / DSM 18059 / JW/NM-WN-LF) TaxID=457570 RepID=B2A5N2_NATTJ|nr:DNA polymerase/3'-5' exonuclease PolX [Natranaerobius thermophilus]ACB85386.1 PHP domain protein [Natranaerobius thermophilus JW/NM-WN-LF]